MEERYRADYEGEYVITGLRIVNGRKQQEREFIENPLNINSISGRATCVSVGDSSTRLYLDRLTKYHGLLNTLPLNVYTTGNLYNKVHANFHITFNRDYLQELVDQDLTEKIMVYTSNSNCIKTPGEFFIIPYGVKGTEESIAAYLAAFDGHTEVFLLGYDEYTNDGQTRRTKMIESLMSVFDAYSTVKFYHVIAQGNKPTEWLQYRNVKSMTVTEYVSYCDIS